jgi:hypothetical protein
MKMDDEKFQNFLGDLLEFLTHIEDGVGKLKQRLVELTGVVIKGCIKPARPVPVDDPAIKWLLKRLDMIKSAHPTVWFKVQTDEKGFVTGLEFSCFEEEHKADIESCAKWAFEKAAGR